MRKMLSALLVLMLSLCLVSAQAESGSEYEFLIGDWKLEGAAPEAQTAFLFDDYDCELTDDSGASEEGAWTFDGETLVLTFHGGKEMTLKWDEEAQQFTGEYKGAALVMSMDVEDEDEDDDTVEAELLHENAPLSGLLTGGWAAAEDWAVTDSVTALVGKAQEQLMGVDYVPAAYLGSQVVAGTNHAVLCRAAVTAPGAQPYWAVLYLYEDLEGNVSVLDIDSLVLGIGSPEPVDGE